MTNFSITNLEKQTPQNIRRFKSLKRSYSKRKFFKAVRRQNSPLFTSILRTGAVLPIKHIGVSSCLFMQLDLDYDIYASVEEYDALKDRMLTKASDDDTFLTRVFKKIEYDCSTYLREIKKYSAAIGQADRKKLQTLYTTFAQRSQDVARFLWTPLVPEEWIVKEIRSELEKKIPSDQDIESVLSELIAPAFITHTQQMRIELLKFVKTHSNLHSKKTIQFIKKISNRYTWLSDHYLRLTYSNENWVLAELTKLKKTKEDYRQFLQAPNVIEKRRNSLIKKYQLNKRTKTLIQQASALPYLRLLRAEVILEGAFYMRNMFKKIGNEINFNEVPLLHYFEITDALKGKKMDFQTIKKRERGFGLIVDTRKIYVLNYLQAKELKQHIKQTFKQSEDISGNVAFMGKVKGKVKILYSGKENHKIQKGDVLVTSMTTPDFVPAMERAVAIITDEGGISCHAAIVARELKKPCVIGTKNATKILKDGDLVEVDAIKGIVKKI